MGETAKQIVGAFIASTLIDAVSELMSASQTLAASATVIVEEEMDHYNVNQVVEAAARCIDTVELIILAATNGRDFSDTEIQRDLDLFKKKLDEIRESILQMEGEA